MTATTCYSPSVYQGLPHLISAMETYNEVKPQMIIEQKMMELFLKHEVWNELCVCLIHRHFDMDDNEKLVEFGAVSTPWAYRFPDNDVMGGSVKPRSWLFGKDGKMVPFEFGYNDGTAAELVYKDLPDKPAFYREFHQLLRDSGLEGLLGLTLKTESKVPGLVKVEKTFGRANVMFTMAEDAHDASNKDYVPAQWEFAPVGDILVPVRRGNCWVICVCTVTTR